MNEKSFWKRLSLGSTKEIPTPRTNHSGGIWQDRFYIFGGFQTKPKKPLNDLWYFDLTKKHWCNLQPKGDIPSSRFCHSLVIYENQLIIFGGYDGELHLNDVYTYDIHENVWSLKQTQGALPNPRIHHGCIVYGSSLIVFGGLSGTQRLNDLYFLSLGSYTWLKVESQGVPPEPRLAHTCSVFQNKMFVFGGYIRNQRMNDLHVLDLGNLTWQQLLVTGNTPAPRYGHSSTVIGSKLVVFGGSNELGKHLDDLSILDLETQNWKFLGFGDIGASHHCVAMGPDGRTLYLFGGSRELESSIFYLSTDSVDGLRICSFDQTNDEIQQSLSELLSESQGNLPPGLEPKLKGLASKIKRQFSELLSEKERINADNSEQLREIEKERLNLRLEKEKMMHVQRSLDSRIRLNVGGCIFETSTATLTADPESMLASMFSGRYLLAKDDSGSIFIDRDGTYFRYILNYLRNGKLVIPQSNPTMIEELLYEARFYQLDNLIEQLEKIQSSQP